MGSTRAGRRRIAQLLAVCTVLFGLFLMHGAPTAAAGGCHGAMPTTTASPMAESHDAAVTTMAAHAPIPAARVMDSAGMPGVLCVSTPAHERTPLPAPGLLGVVGIAVLALATPARRAAVGGTGRRAPPGSGRELLLKVCVART
ncbi:hypothetical protein ACFVTY_30700 [Streptomyces sp. NPDC058067]|uniref:hypothetical protein n=1 Tax=Streptomyces sp. NPDC058067 TaxID=3346324 RepID=UPI0036E374CA